MMYDVIVIGSGFGGAMAAWAFVHAGARVLMLERGPWISRAPENWATRSVMQLGPAWDDSTPYLLRGEETGARGGFYCVGGPSVYYGGVSLRFRERDFECDADVATDSGARWPIRYADIEPYYSLVEQLLLVAGRAGTDPTEPPRSAPLPQPPPALSATSRRIDAAARRLGLHPSLLPLAIDFAGRNGHACLHCMTCDGFACAIGAKGDVAGRILPDLVRRGLELRTNEVVTRLYVRNGHVSGVESVHRAAGTRTMHRARYVVLAAGALASPHLVLASGLHRWNPGGLAAGRYLTRHCNAIVYGVFREPAGLEPAFHKQLAIHDFYFGDPDAPDFGRLGAIQQIHPPPPGLVHTKLPRLAWRLFDRLIARSTGLIVIAEDQPAENNGVTLDDRRTDRYGRPVAVVEHRYAPRDRQACRMLARRARRVLQEAGASLTHVFPIRTFSHALGTLRMGDDPHSSVLDEACRFRGMDNLIVTDGSVFATPAAVNPSLTIAALALRAADRLTGGRLLEQRAHEPRPVQLRPRTVRATRGVPD